MYTKIILIFICGMLWKKIDIYYIYVNKISFRHFVIIICNNYFYVYSATIGLMRPMLYFIKNLEKKKKKYFPFNIACDLMTAHQ